MRSGAGADIQASAEMEGSVVEEACDDWVKDKKEEKVDDLRSKAAEMKLLKIK